MNCKLGLFALFFSSLLWQTEVEGMAGASMEKEPDVVLRKQDSGKEITVKAGKVIQVQLERGGESAIGGMHKTPAPGIFCPFQKRPGPCPTAAWAGRSWVCGPSVRRKKELPKSR